MVLEKTLESPLDCKEMQSVHAKGDQPWVFFGRNDAKAQTPVLWPPDLKSWFIWKDSDAWRDWGQEEKGTTEDDAAGWHHRLNGHEPGELRKMVMDREAWHAAIYGVAKSRTQLSDWPDWTDWPPHCGFFFVLGCRISFFDEFQHPPVKGCSAASCNFSFPTGIDEHMSFHTAIYLHTQKNGYSYRFYFHVFQNHCGWWLSAMKLKVACSLEEKQWQAETVY